jgi:hypothetical protein
MSNKENLAALDRNIEASKEFVALGAALIRLYANKDFRSVILSGYFEKEAVRLVHLKSAPQMQTPDRQVAIIRDIDSIGALHQYLALVDSNAATAERNIEADELTREDILREDMGGN